LTPYDQITSRDNDAFPFQTFLDYPRCFMIDWRAAPMEVAEGFIKAAGLTGRATITPDAAGNGDFMISYVDKITLRFNDHHSRQHQVLKMLQVHFGIRNAIRYVNHAAAGDTAYCVVESLSTWERLEKANPHVKWFFTPYQLLPDIINASFDEISACGRKYADG